MPGIEARLGRRPFNRFEIGRHITYSKSSSSVLILYLGCLPGSITTCRKSTDLVRDKQASQTGDQCCTALCRRAMWHISCQRSKSFTFTLHGEVDISLGTQLLDTIQNDNKIKNNPLIIIPWLIQQSDNGNHQPCRESFSKHRARSKSGSAHLVIQSDSKTCWAEGRSSGLNASIARSRADRHAFSSFSIPTIPHLIRGSWIEYSNRVAQSRRGEPSFRSSCSLYILSRFVQRVHHSEGRRPRVSTCSSITRSLLGNQVSNKGRWPRMAKMAQARPHISADRERGVEGRKKTSGGLSIYGVWDL